MALTVVYYQDHLISGVSLSSSSVNEAQHFRNRMTLSHHQGKSEDVSAHCGLIE